MNLVKEYQKNSVMTSDGVGVIILLYDGVMDFTNRAQAAIGEGKIAERTRYINKSIDIIGELLGSLDMERGGAVAKNLSRLYAYMLEELMRANLRNDAKPLKTVSALIGELKKGWEGLRANGAREEQTDEGEYPSISARF